VVLPTSIINGIYIEGANHCKLQKLDLQSFSHF
jgi:hypothetical protein